MSVCYGGMGGKKALKHDDTSFFFSGREWVKWVRTYVTARQYNIRYHPNEARNVLDMFMNRLYREPPISPSLFTKRNTTFLDKKLIPAGEVPLFVDMEDKSNSSRLSIQLQIRQWSNRPDSIAEKIAKKQGIPWRRPFSHLFSQFLGVRIQFFGRNVVKSTFFHQLSWNKFTFC